MSPRCKKNTPPPCWAESRSRRKRRYPGIALAPSLTSLVSQVSVMARTENLCFVISFWTWWILYTRRFTFKYPMVKQDWDGLAWLDNGLNTGAEGSRGQALGRASGFPVWEATGHVFWESLVLVVGNLSDFDEHEVVWGISVSGLPSLGGNFQGRAVMLSGQNSSSRMFAASASSAETDRRADFVPNSFDLRKLQEDTLTFLLRQYFMSAASSQSTSMPPTKSTHLLMGTAPLSTEVDE